MTATMVKYKICIFIFVFFCNPWPRKCMFRHKDFFLSGLETEILKHVYSGGHFKKWPLLRSKVKCTYLLLVFL